MSSTVLDGQTCGRKMGGPLKGVLSREFAEGDLLLWSLAVQPAMDGVMPTGMCRARSHPQRVHLAGRHQIRLAGLGVAMPSGTAAAISLRCPRRKTRSAATSGTRSARSCERNGPRSMETGPCRAPRHGRDITFASYGTMARGQPDGSRQHRSSATRHPRRLRAAIPSVLSGRRTMEFSRT